MPVDFQWFELEISAVRTGKFFRTCQPVAAESLSDFESQFGSLPNDYKSFLIRFGETQLFRIAERDDYAITIDRIPQIAHVEGRDHFVSIGLCDGNPVYVILSPPEKSQTTILTHRSTGGIVDSGKGFSEWLESNFAREKAKYSKQRWAAIVAGPPPFSDQELQIINARHQWQLRKVGADRRNNLVIEVTNNSSRLFKYITAYIRSGWIKAHTPVRVDHVGPGATAQCTINFYRDRVSAADAEILPLMEIGPEDRELLFELKGPTWFRNCLAKGALTGNEIVE